MIVHSLMWLTMATVYLFMATVSFLSALAVEGVVSSETYFLVADLLVCAAAIYCLQRLVHIPHTEDRARGIVNSGLRPRIDVVEGYLQVPLRQQVA